MILYCLRYIKCAIQSLIISIRPEWTVFGSAKYLDPLNKLKLLNPFHEGMVIEHKGKLTKEKSFKGILMVSATGFGKSTSYVLPNLLQEHSSKPSFIITDPSSELFEKSSGWLQSQGYDVKRIDFSGNQTTFTYNPLANISDINQIERLANNLVHASSSKNHGDTFWQDKATELLTVLIRCLLHSNINIEYQNLCNIRLLLNSFGTDGSPLNKFFELTAQGSLANEVLGIISMESKILQGAIATCKASIRLWSNEKVCQITNSNTINISEIRKSPTAIFVSLNESETSYYQPLLNQFYTDVFHNLMRMPSETEKDIFILLDEGGNLYIKDFEQLITVCRKRRVSISLIVQSLTQIESKYGKTNAQTIIENLQNKIFAPGLDIENSCAYVEKLLGKKTEVYQNPADDWFEHNTDKPKQFTGRPLMTADEFRRSNYPIFFSENASPVVLKKMTPFYKDKTLQSRSNLPSSVTFPELPNLSYLDIFNI